MTKDQETQFYRTKDTKPEGLLSTKQRFKEEPLGILQNNDSQEDKTRLNLEVALSHLKAGDMATCEHYLKKVILANPSDTAALSTYGQLALSTGRFNLASSLFSRALDTGVKTALLWRLLLKSLVAGENKAGLARLLRSMQIAAVDDIELLTSIAEAYNVIEDPESALRYYKQIDSIDISNPTGLDGILRILAAQGKPQEARSVAKKLFYSHGDNPSVIRNILRFSDYFEYDSNARLKALGMLKRWSAKAVHQSNISLSRCIYFAYGQILDLEKRYQDAFKAYITANIYRLQDLKLDTEEDYSNLVSNRNHFYNMLSKRVHIHSDPSELCKREDDEIIPIIVLGLPRSGTTLVEQIILNGGGEHCGTCGETNILEDIINKSGAGAKDLAALDSTEASYLARSIYSQYLIRLKEYCKSQHKHRFIIDKQLYNYLYLPLIIRMPLRIIYCTRQPADLYISNIKADFRWKNSFVSSSHAFIRFFRHYHESMKTLLDASGSEMIKRLSYEDLAKFPEESTQDLANFLNLEWSPAWINTAENNNTISTASMMQVRRPINTGSIGSHLKYINADSLLLSDLNSIVFS